MKKERKYINLPTSDNFKTLASNAIAQLDNIDATKLHVIDERQQGNFESKIACI